MKEAVSVAVVVLAFGIGAWFGHADSASAQYVTRREYLDDRAKDRERQYADSINAATTNRILVKLSCQILHDCTP